MRRLIAALLFVIIYAGNVHADTTTGLVGWWKFEEGSGNALDSTGQGFTGTLVNSPIRITGKRGMALSFNGSNQYINAGGAGNFTSSNFTLSGWFYFTELSASRQPVILYKGGYTSQGYYIQIISTGSIWFHTNQSGAVQITKSSVAAVNTNNWHLITIIRNGSSVRIYVNGADVTSTADTHIDPADSAENFQIGTYQQQTGNTLPLAGMADDIRIYNRALIVQDVYMLYLGDNKIRNAVMRNVQFK